MNATFTVLALRRHMANHEDEGLMGQFLVR